MTHNTTISEGKHALLVQLYLRLLADRGRHCAKAEKWKIKEMKEWKTWKEKWNRHLRLNIVNLRPTTCWFVVLFVNNSDICPTLHCSVRERRAILIASHGSCRATCSVCWLWSRWSWSCCDLQLWIFSTLVSWQSSGCWNGVLAPAGLLSDDVFVAAAESRRLSLQPLI